MPRRFLYLRVNFSIFSARETTIRMIMRRSLPGTCLWSLPLLLLIAGCGGGPTPEQRFADSVFTAAKEAIVQNRHSASRTMLQEALRLDTALKRPAKVAEQLRLLGRNHAAAAEFDSALLLLSRSAEEYRSLAARGSIRDVQLEIAALYRQMGEARRAQTMYTEASRLAQIFGELQGLNDIRWASLGVLRELERYDDEGRILSELQNYHADDFAAQARVQLEMGLSAYDRTDYAPATEHFLRSLTLADQSRDTLLAIRALMHAAAVHVAQQRVPEGFQLYTEGLRRSDVTAGARALREEMLIRVGNVYMRGGQFGDAARFYRAARSSAIQRRNRIAEGMLFVQLGHCELEAGPGSEEARKSYETALDLFRGYGFQYGSAYALFSLGQLAQRRGGLTEALQFYKEAIEEYETLVCNPLAGNVLDECIQVYLEPRGPSLYHAIIELLLVMGRNEEAYWYLERQNARELSDVLGGLYIRTSSDSLNAALAAWRHQKALRVGAERAIAEMLMGGSDDRDLLADLRRSLENTAKALEEKATQVVEKRKAYAPVVRQGNLGLPEVQRMVPAGSALIHHVSTRRGLYIFVITGTRAAVQIGGMSRDQILTAGKEFTGLLRTREVYADSGRERLAQIDRRVQELASLLYSACIRPIQRDLAGVSQLLIVPSSELASVPMHALRSGIARGSPYLIEQFSVAYLPSAFALSLGGKPARSVTDVVGLGHPGRTDWDVEYELKDIRAFYKEARLHFVQAATLSTLQKEKADLVHLALDVHFSHRAPGNSYAVFSDGKAFDTMTEVPWGELFSLPAFPTVVVSDLSDQPQGLHRAQALVFLMNGSSVVVMNGLPPLRRAKKYFGELFYTALLAGSTGAAAFRTAPLEMLKDRQYASPHMWAPFWLWGK